MTRTKKPRPRTTERSSVSRVTKRMWRRYLRRFCQVVGVLAMIFAAVYAVYRHATTSPQYVVPEVVVRGARTLSAEAIVAHSGITNEDRIFQIPVERVCQQLEALPRVKSCCVERFLPNKVRITIQERVAAATLLVRGRLFEIDNECFVLDELALGDECPGPLISGADSMQPAVGKRLESAVLQVSLRVSEEFSRTDMSKDVTVAEIAAVSVNDIRMYCDELPFEVRWGRGDAHLQARRLDIWWEQVGAMSDFRQYVDLRFGRDVACM